jgi:hypothetical protein
VTKTHRRCTQPAAAPCFRAQGAAGSEFSALLFVPEGNSLAGLVSRCVAARVRARMRGGFELGDHGRAREQQPPDRIARVMHQAAEAQTDPPAGQVLDDVARIGERAREPVELGTTSVSPARQAASARWCRGARSRSAVRTCPEVRPGCRTFTGHFSGRVLRDMLRTPSPLKANALNQSHGHRKRPRISVEAR